MPPAEAVLNTASMLANEWRLLAIVWHVLLAALLIAACIGRVRSSRTVGVLAAAPFASVSALSWWSGNPFNGAVFATLAMLLVAIASRWRMRTVSIDRRPLTLLGGLLVTFGWTYPHFLSGPLWGYAYAAPFGVLPCPTLSVVIGVTLILGLHRYTAWSAALAIVGLTYGAIGVVWLGVILDYGLLAGAALLAGATAYQDLASVVMYEGKSRHVSHRT
jgi:hypothetical protein